MPAYSEASIVVIDELEATRTFIQRVLERQGYSNVHLLADVGQLKDFVSQNLDLLIVGLPQADEMELGLLSIAKVLLSDETIPILALLTEDTSIGRQEVSSLGVMDSLVKPPSVHLLVQRVQLLLQTRFLQQDYEFRKRRLENVRHREKGDGLQGLLLDELKSMSHCEPLIDQLAKLAEFRDDLTGQHTLRVAALVEKTLLQLGLNGQESFVLKQAAKLHDLGKLMLSDRILLKQGVLSHEERQAMQLHCQAGADLLANRQEKVLQHAERIAKSHHERWDGSGYPDALAGEEIPFEARVVAIADVYDALSHRRPFKDAWPHDKVIAYLKQEQGKHFDPEIFRAFLSGVAAS